MSGTLCVVATPIGHLKDITLRALETLKACDVIVCEDTRVTSKLLSAYDISKPLKSIHEHASEGAVERIIDLLREGKHLAYVSDAGTPNVNDPGGKLVQAAFEAGMRIEAIPGPSALTAAISVCGFPMDEFTYLGFIPHKKGRKTFFEEIAGRRTPSAFLESTHRIEKTMESLVTTLSANRKIFIGRELTKMHETLYRGTASDVQKRVLGSSTKGEFVIIVGPETKG